MGWLTDPFAFDFFRSGVLVATLAGALCAAVGCYVVLRGMSYIGHGLSHAVLAGFAVSSIAGFSYLIGAGLWGFGSALLIGRVARRTGRSDAAIAVITTTSFALGLALLQRYGSANRDPDAVLFGNALGVGLADVATIAVVGLVVATAMFTRYRALLFTAFDPDVAAVSGIKVSRMDALLMALLTLSVLASMRVLGVTLVAAAVVTPAATARLLTDRFAPMLGLAVGLGAAGGFVGMIVSYHLDIAPGPAIVLLDGVAFALAYGAAAVKGRTPRTTPRARPPATDRLQPTA